MFLGPYGPPDFLIWKKKFCRKLDHRWQFSVKFRDDKWMGKASKRGNYNNNNNNNNKHHKNNSRPFTWPPNNINNFSRGSRIWIFFSDLWSAVKIQSRCLHNLRRNYYYYFFFMVWPQNLINGATLLNDFFSQACLGFCSLHCDQSAYS
jgi:hypothetical protein